MIKGTKQQNKPIPDRLQYDVWDMCAFISIIVALISVFILPYVLYDDFQQPTKTLLWDLNGLENELAERVYGQDEAVGIITKTLRQVIEIPQNNSQHIIFLLVGGTGVGKHHVVNIIKNHIKCQHKNKPIEDEPCQIQYHNKMILNGDQIRVNRTDVLHYFNGSLPLFIDFNSLEYPLHSNNIIDVLKNNIYYYDEVKFCFITGIVMSETTTKSINNSTEYENLVYNEAQWMEIDLKSEFSRSNVIIVNLKPLKHDHVTRCLQDQQVNNVTLDYSKDFVSLGCKTR